MLNTYNQNLIINLSDQNNSTQILPYRATISSQADWQSLYLSQYNHPPHETPEHVLSHHVIAIAQNQFHLEVRKNGKFQHQLVHDGIIQLTPAKITQSLAWTTQSKFLLLSLDPQFLEQATDDIIKRRLELIPQFSIIDPIIQHIALALQADIVTGSNTGKLFVDSAATMLATHIVKAYATYQPIIKQYQDGLAKNKLHIVIDYIDSHLEQDIKLSDLAKLIEVSQYYFCTLFKQSTGLPPHKYLIQQRVQRAKFLLQHTNLSIADIALQSGFTDQSHLNKHFKRLVGVTPKAIR
ncbi:AraC family transcriptional regulator [Calothrix sp. NIES-4071]|nr:AraC family transcriptional regulator [Calothrix sp. NIES-4071]BAZ60025.1 AraC family transcriptional regulator [Calothrix sp. NIES-4105]